ncbi:hypothetical protein BLNAU_13992 [Blattamonas nauphoetae]|uniref:Tetraspanin family protein n=1 Tax=Blattamonas nauphoetae TaxID=2049346 RepID=A0ABQ9XGB6_9EUKA|nr:hypothetical protein BLNAU_13992 [Blattamonas nauphoetae]
MCCLPEDHEKKCCAGFFIILNIIYALVGLAILILGAIFMGMMKTAQTFTILLIVVGAFIIIMSIFGFVGSCHYPGNDNKCPKVMLNIFWIVAFLAAILLIAFGVVCFASPKTIQSAVAWAFEDFLKTETPGITETLVKALKTFINSITALGVVGIVGGVLIVLGFICVCYLLGKLEFLNTTSRYGSILISLVGVLALIIFIFLLVGTENPTAYQNLSIIGIVIAAILIFVGIWGFVNACCCLGKKCPSIFNSIFLTIITLACLAAGIIVAILVTTVKQDEVQSKFSSKCFANASVMPKDSECKEIIRASLRLVCDNKTDLPECTPEGSPDCICTTDLEKITTKDHRDNVVKGILEYIYAEAVGNVIIIGIALVVIALFILYMTVTSYILCCCCNYGEDLSESWN